MKTIYLISCCKEKLSHPAKAVDLYQSEGFKRRLSIAQTHNPERMRIASGLCVCEIESLIFKHSL